MQESGYEAPRSIEDTVALLQGANGNARILAGGTDLLAQMRTGVVSPELLVDVKKIPQLSTIEATGDGGFRIGAAVCGAALGENEALKRAWPGVVEAAELIGSAQIQGRASLGGNLCNASPAADSVPALIAAAAKCTIAGPSGTREEAVESIVTGPGQTTLAAGEFVVDFILPAPAPRSGSAYIRSSDRWF